jgi:periplasmic divalent cation tolerance protein
MPGYTLILSTVPDEKTGRLIARALVEERLAACVTVSPSGRSFYRWQGKIVEESERVLFIKTRAALYKRLEAKLKSLHPYAVPEAISIPVVAGSKKYLSWIEKETARVVLGEKKLHAG